MEPEHAIVAIHLYNHHNLFYSGPIDVGTPSKRFYASFDTSAHEIWIPDRTIVADGFRPRGNTFSRSPNTNAHLRARHLFDLRMDGIRRTDEFHAEALQIRSQFCLVHGVEPADYYDYTGWTAIVGLSFSPPAPHNYSPPIWSIMSRHNLLFDNIFSVWMRDFNVSGTNGGQIVFGAAIEEHFDNEEGHEFYNIIEDCHEWMIRMSFVNVGQIAAIQQMEAAGMQIEKALIHTGSPYIYGSRRIIRRINRRILGDHLYGLRVSERRRRVRLGEPVNDVDSYMFTVAEIAEITDAWRTVAFVFAHSERIYSLSAQEYIMHNDEEGYSSVFRPNDSPDADYLTLGMPFLRRYHSIFDFVNRRIGFAPAAA